MPAMLGRLPIVDVLHRTILFGLVGLGAFGILTGVQVHRSTLQRGKGAMFDVVMVLFPSHRFPEV